MDAAMTKELLIILAANLTAPAEKPVDCTDQLCVNVLNTNPIVHPVCDDGYTLVERVVVEPLCIRSDLIRKPAYKCQP